MMNYPKKKSILVIGGLGYIGSNVVVALIKSAFDVLILDNLSTSNLSTLEDIFIICGERPTFIKGDIRNKNILTNIFDKHNIDAVFHFANSKDVYESVANPISYYDNNVSGSINLASAMLEAGVKVLIYSSSASVYGAALGVPINEESAIFENVMSPYARTKLMTEYFLNDIYRSGADISIRSLRYFNPLGCHSSGLLSEPYQKSTSLASQIIKILKGDKERLEIFGNDYASKDGTPIRDFIHINDIVSGHLAALAHAFNVNECMPINLGSGAGYTVLELVKMFELVSGREIPYIITSRRTGDIPISIADIKKACDFFNWTPTASLESMCRDILNGLDIQPI